MPNLMAHFSSSLSQDNRIIVTCSDDDRHNTRITVTCSVICSVDDIHNTIISYQTYMLR